MGPGAGSPGTEPLGAAQLRRCTDSFVGAVGGCSPKLPSFLSSVPLGAAESSNTHCFMRRVSSYIWVTLLINC